MITEDELTKQIIRIISDESKIPIDEILPTHSFFELGLDSISAIFMMEKLEHELQVELNPIFFWDYPTIEEYARYIVNEVMSHESN